MNPSELHNFINGEYVVATTSSSFALINPATEESYATSPISGTADVDAAFSAAAAAFIQWGETTPAERQLALFRIADALEARAEEFADLES
jgi:betaine-aldehyde dehydrogenase